MVDPTEADVSGQRADKEELYAQNLAAGMDKHKAYLAAGYKGTEKNAIRKSKEPNIVKRVVELLDVKKDQMIVDEKWVVAEMVSNHLAAKAAEKFETCRAQLRDIGQHIGMFIERHDIRVLAKFEPLSHEQVLQQLADASRQLVHLKQENAPDEPQ